MQLFDEVLEAAKDQFPQLVDEYLRLRLWVGTCVGADVAMPGGPEVE